MRIDRLIAAGFRGFNSERTIDFHEKLTLVSAPNSHGKTSITEALEFLLYGQTSKVEAADSKDEYKDSYYNRHYPTSGVPFVEARCSHAQDGPVVLRVEVHPEGIRRFVNSKPVSEWPFATIIDAAARPFVVQHALKSLLLAAPSDRFQRFARLLGLREVDSMQQVLVNLCTKPEAHIPPMAKRLLADLDLFDSRLRASKDTTPIAKALDKGPAGVADAYTRLHTRGVALVGESVPEAALSPALVVLRNAAAGKIYSGSVAITEPSASDLQRASAAREKIERALKSVLVEDYTRLAVGDTADRLRKQLQVLGLGLELLEDKPDTCPFCEQNLTEGLRVAAEHRCEALRATVGTGSDLSTLRAQLAAQLKELGASVTIHQSIQTARSADLVAASTDEAIQKVKALFGEGNENSLFLVAAAGASLAPRVSETVNAVASTRAAIDVCLDAIHRKAEDIAQIEALTISVAQYLAKMDAYIARLEELSPTLAQPARLLQHVVDANAGTTELSLLIEMLNSRAEIGRAVRIRNTIQGLKDLKKHVEQAVSQTMEDAFSTDLSGAVMGWYKRIKTTSDPDVHFSGFAMERTKGGDFKSRRVKVAAQSYGVELASAVSSLSESKLNALGLCISIATALRAPGPWSFLILDDPIQSWDDDHEDQFIRVIRALVEEEGKQIILMSHREGWIDQVADGCRSINGARYHITGYTKDGPVMRRSDWATLDERLKEALNIAKDPTASAVRLQQAEEEIRIAACQLTADVAKLRLNRIVSGHSMNSDKARAILIESGCPAALLDRVVSTFATTDPAHHAPKGYAPNAERIRQYHGALTELRNWLRPS